MACAYVQPATVKVHAPAGLLQVTNTRLSPGLPLDEQEAELISQVPVAGLVIALAAFATPSAAQPVAKAKCMNHTLADCRAMIAKTFSGTRYSVVSSNIDDILNTPPKYDVSGNLLKAGSAKLIISAPRPPLVISTAKSLKPIYIKRSPFYHIVTISFGDDMIVTEIKVGLASDILPANTADDYDATNIFPLVSPFLPFDCAERTKSNFYKFLHEVLKPSTRMKRDGYIGAGSAADGYEYYTTRANLCHIYISYERSVGVSTAYMDSDNPSGKYENINVTLWSHPK